MDLFNYSRHETIEVNIGNTALGGNNPIRVQSMTNVSTNDVEACVAQAKRIVDAGGEYVRLTTQGVREAESLKEINAGLRKDGYDVPLVADLSSCILSRPIDVSKFAVIYAGAQKNVAPAGLTIVIIREDLLHNVNPVCPTMCDYTINAEAKSMHNTPPCWSIYICKLVLDWLLSIGGLEEMERRNLKKAALLYNYLDSTDFYAANVSPESRSIMNVRFNTPNEELDAKFVKESVAAGMTNLKAHRSTGGLRASIYNCMPYEGVECLVDFMKKFEAENK